MDKNIIIDGINVAGCEYYYRCDCKINNDTDINLCKWHDDCYYKQFKRAEQENKELKEDLKSQQMINLEQQEIALDYWNALEEIQKIITADCKGCTAECDCEDDCTRHKIKNKINEVLE